MSRGTAIALGIGVLTALVLARRKGQAANELNEFYHLRFDIDTTSDWIALNMPTEHLIGAVEPAWAVDPVPDKYHAATPGTIALGQVTPFPPGDLERISCSVDCIFDKNLSAQEFTLTAKKGSWGDYHVKVTLVESGLSEVVLLDETYSVGDEPNNTKLFSIFPAALGPYAVMLRPRRVTPKYVGAFYYQWWFAEEMNPVKYTDHQLYTGSPIDPALIDTHIALAKSAGVDFFMCSYGTAAEDSRFGPLMAQCALRGFKSTIYFESQTKPDGVNRMTEDELVEVVTHVLSTYGSSPGFMKVGGKYFLPVYAVNLAGAAKWSRVMARVAAAGYDVLWNGSGYDYNYHDYEHLLTWDGMHLYGIITKLDTVEADYATIRKEIKAVEACTRERRMLAAVVCPGCDNSKFKAYQGVPEQTIIVPHNDGDTYTRMWNAAIAADPDMIMITSWNEWAETTEIEPSVEHGTKYLDMTRQFIARWKRMA